jgi:hypothetical protein
VTAHHTDHRQLKPSETGVFVTLPALLAVVTLYPDGFSVLRGRTARHVMRGQEEGRTG